MSSISLMYISFILFVVSLYLYKKPNKLMFTIFFFFIMIICSFLLFITYWVSDYFTGNGIDESTIYHLKYGLDGAGFLEYKGLIAIIISLLILGLIGLLWFYKKKKSYRSKNVLAYSLLFISLFINPATIDLYKVFKIDYSVSDEFYKYYRNPYLKQISESTKNLVFIYAEGLERTFFNQNVFPGLIKELSKLEARSIYFSNILQVPGNGFTIAGIVTSQLGIPLVTKSSGNSMGGMDQFLPSATGLGDLLHDEGYYLTFIGGADLRFAGKGKFFKTHGFDEVLGRKELLPELIDKTYQNAWGLHDDTLFEILYRRFLELSRKKKKFGLFTLTLGTHHPDGFVPKKFNNIKYRDGTNPILNAIACSDLLISNFINKIINSEFAHNTLIILVSDHLALKTSAHDMLTGEHILNGKKKRLKRRNLFMIIDPNNKISTNITTIGSNIDIGPTILPFVGFTGEIGLGRNLLKGMRPGISIKKYIQINKEKWNETIKERSYIQKKLNNWKGSISKFWDFPKIQNSISINTENKTIKIDNRSFKIPILIELNEQLNSTLTFHYNVDIKDSTLFKYLHSINNKKHFLLIDKSKNLSKINYYFNRKNFYLIAGKGGKKKYNRIIKLGKKNTFTVKKIRKLLRLNIDK